MIKYDKIKIFWLPIISIWALVYFIILVDGFIIDRKLEHGWFYAYQNLIAGALAFGGGSFVLFAVKKQIKASIKEKFIHDFRISVKEFLSHASRILEIEEEGNKLGIEIDFLKKQTINDKNTSEIEELIERMNKCIENLDISSLKAHSELLSLQLFLDLKNDLHIKFISKLEEFSTKSRSFKNLMSDPIKNKKELDRLYTDIWDAKKSIIDISKNIINAEFEKI